MINSFLNKYIGWLYLNVSRGIAVFFEVQFNDITEMIYNKSFQKNYAKWGGETNGAYNHTWIDENEKL